MYSIILFLVTIVGWIMVVPSVSTWMKSWIPFCWNAPKITWAGQFGDMLNKSNVVPKEWVKMLSDETKNGTKTICDDFTGYLAVYRLMFATTLFFIVFAFIMVRVRNNRDPRAQLHNGLWPIKFLLLLAGIVGAFFIPTSDGFTETWKVFGFIGSFLFLVIQFYFIIDFADNWATGWVSQMEDGSTEYYYYLLFTSLANVALTITGVVLLFVYYTAEGCGLHKFVISFNLILCFILTVMSVLPKIQEYNEASGLLQASLVSLYVVYLTWSALNSSPYSECRPSFLSSSNDTNLSRESFISLLICFACVLYSSFRLSSHFLASTGVSTLTAEEGGSGKCSFVLMSFPLYVCPLCPRPSKPCHLALCLNANILMTTIHFISAQFPPVHH